jgi:hypothetical protein
MEKIELLLEKLEITLKASQPNIKYIEMEGIIHELKSELRELGNNKPTKTIPPSENEVTVNSQPQPTVTKKSTTTKK